MLIRPVQVSDVDSLLDMLQQSGQFDDAGLNNVQEALSSFFSGGSESLWFSAKHQGLAGIAYCAQEIMADRVWNLLLLWVNPANQRQGVGMALVNRIEQELNIKQARLLLVETSSLDDFSAARAFYRSQGFTVEAIIRNYYANLEDKLIFSKTLYQQ